MAINDPVPSTAFDVLQRNVQDVDRYLNTSTVFNNRVGLPIKPIPMQSATFDSLETQWLNAIGAVGWFPVSGDFSTGATLTTRNQVIYDPASTAWYSWGGTLPKTVPTSSSPASTGGISAGAWTMRSDATLRNDVKIRPHLKTLEASIFPQIVTSFYEAGNGGGGVFNFDPTTPKANHNGYSVIAPEALSAWDGTPSGVPSFLQWTGSGAGAFVRVGFCGDVDPIFAGAVSGVPFDAGLLFDIARRDGDRIVVGAGFNFVSYSRIFIRTNSRLLVVGGGMLSADPSQPVRNYGFLTVRTDTGADPVLDWSISGDGTIDASNRYDQTIDVVYARFSSIDIYKLRGGNINGLLVGSDTTKPSTDVHCGVREVFFHERYDANAPKNTADSIGVYYKGCTDADVVKCEIVGYRCGGRSDSGSVHWDRPHAWTRTVCGPMSCGFDMNGSGCTMTSPDADTPTSLGDPTVTEVYGIRVRRFNIKIVNPRVFLNETLSRDDEVIAYDCTVNDSQVVLIGAQAAGRPTAKYKQLMRGFTGRYTQIGFEDDGNFYGSAPDNYIGSRRLRVDRSLLVDENATVNGSGAFGSFLSCFSSHSLQANTGENADLYMRRGVSLRWSFRMANPSETGSNAGSNLQLIAYDDNGAFLSTPIQVNRRFGTVILGDAAKQSDVNINLNNRTDPTATGTSPEGFVRIVINGQEKKIPYYAV